MEYFDDPEWIKNKLNKMEYNTYDDIVNFKKINEHVLKIIPSYLEDEIKEFKIIQNKLRSGTRLTEEDRNFFKLFHETLDHLYSNIGQIVNNVYEVSIGKHN